MDQETLFLVYVGVLTAVLGVSLWMHLRTSLALDRECTKKQRWKSAFERENLKYIEAIKNWHRVLTENKELKERLKQSEPTKEMQ